MALNAYNALYYKDLIIIEQTLKGDGESLFKVCYYYFIKFLEDKAVYLIEVNLLYPSTPDTIRAL
jgi:hypothetical protein